MLFNRQRKNFSSAFSRAAFFIFFILVLFPVSAQSFFNKINWAYMGGLQLLASDNGIDADPAQITPVLGFSASYPIRGLFYFEFTEDIYFTNFEYNYEYGYPMACNPENRSAFVMGFVTGLHAAGHFPLGNKGIKARVFGGLGFDLRLVIMALGLHPDDEADASHQTNAIRNYFWSKGRMMHVPFGFGFDFPVNSKFMLGLDVRALYPLYRLWTDENIPSIDGWRFGFGLRITPRKQTKPVTAIETQTEETERPIVE